MARWYFVLVLFALSNQAQTGQAIDHPTVVSAEQAGSWLHPSEPVLVVEQGGEARAYPRQILIRHESVNDEIAGVPILVSYDPRADSARAFDRRIGRERRRLPCQTVPFEVFRQAFPAGRVLSRDTGYRRDYGRREPLERVVVVTSDGQRKAYPLTPSQRQGVVEDRLSRQRFAIFFAGDAAGVFSTELEGRRLSFRRKKDQIVDKETGSAWNLLGIATAGPLAGKRLTPVVHDVSLASNWRAADDRHRLPEGIYGRRDQMAVQPWP